MQARLYETTQSASLLVFIKISRIFVHNDSMANKSSLVQVMTCDKQVHK